MALSWAKDNCPEPNQQTSCCHYHGFWQYLRLLGLGKTLSGFSQEFTNAIRQACHSHSAQPLRILISGCADYSAYAHVLHASQGVEPAPLTTAVDLCETPLALTRWYAEQYGGQVDTVCCDILQYKPTQPFDLILTSSFFGYFNPHQRQELFKAYAQLLNPGGAFVCTTRLVNKPESERAGFTADQAKQLLETVIRSIDHLPQEAALSLETATRLAEHYAHRPGSYPVNNLQTIEQLAQRAGLEVRDTLQRRSEARASGVTGPTIGAADYLFIRLVKPI